METFFYCQPGKGKISFTGGSGASHGGRGGRGAGYQFAGYPYGSIFHESLWGSGGGSHVTGSKSGGRGGGFVRMYVREFIQIAGSIITNGLPSTVSKLDILGVTLFKNFQHSIAKQLPWLTNIHFTLIEKQVLATYIMVFFIDSAPLKLTRSPNVRANEHSAYLG